MASLPGWLFVTGGAVVVAACALVPGWLEQRELSWQRDLMAMQHERLQRQTDRYRAFHEALERREPALLERLAYTQLRLAPVGKQPLPGPALGADQAHPYLVATVDRWLAEPMPVVGKDLPELEPIDTRLTRILEQDWTRYSLMAVGVTCMIGGLLWRGGGGGGRRA